MKNKKTPDEYFQAATVWRDEISALRQILLATELTETLKWGIPCYTYSGKNVVGLGVFQSYFGLWFHQGVFLADKGKVLINAQEGKTKALRQWRMTSDNDINSALITAYLAESIVLVRTGKFRKPMRNKPLVMPPELTAALANNMNVETAFEKLSKGLKREYANYIAEAKRGATKQRRLIKILPMIISGKGLNDKYR